ATFAPPARSTPRAAPPDCRPHRLGPIELLALKYLPIQEEQRIECHVLRGGRNAIVHCQSGQKFLHLLVAQGFQVPPPIPPCQSPTPAQVGLFGPIREVRFVPGPFPGKTAAALPASAPPMAVDDGTSLKTSES